MKRVVLFAVLAILTALVLSQMPTVAAFQSPIPEPPTPAPVPTERPGPPTPDSPDADKPPPDWTHPTPDSPSVEGVEGEEHLSGRSTPKTVVIQGGEATRRAGPSTIVDWYRSIDWEVLLRGLYRE